MLQRKTAMYALVSLYEIAQQHRDSVDISGIRAVEIARKHKLPKAYAARILGQMVNAGVLRSETGPHGGFRLNRSAKDISFYDVFDSVGAIEGSKASGPFVENLPPGVRTAMTRACGQAANAIKRAFAKVHLADVLR